MASVYNFANRNITKRILSRYKRFNAICLSTGSKNYEEVKSEIAKKTQYQEIPDFSKPLENKNWVSYGFDYESEKFDKVKMHGLSFFSITICFVFGGFFMMYLPDYNHRHWARREAYIRLYERESLGLDPIDPNYVDPEKMVLPSDEELGDTEIII